MRAAHTDPEGVAGRSSPESGPAGVDSPVLEEGIDLAEDIDPAGGAAGSTGPVAAAGHTEAAEGALFYAINGVLDDEP